MVNRWGEHDNPTHDSEHVKDLNKNIQLSYNWTILTNASTHTRTRKNLEAMIFIDLLGPSFKDQLKSNKLKNLKI